MSDEYTIDNLQIEIEGKVTNASAALDALIETMEKISDLTTKIGKITGGYQKSLDAITSGMNEVNKAAKTFNTKKAERSINNLSDALSKKLNVPLVRRLRELGDVYTSRINFSENDDETRVGGFFNNIKQMSKSGLAQGFAKTLETITADVKKLPNLVGTAFQKITISSLKLLSKPLVSFGSKVLGFFPKVTNKIQMLAKRFRTLALNRLLRNILGQITGSVREGVNNLYAWSQNVGGVFAGTMDRMSSSLQYFKNSVGAAVAPLLNAFAPVLDTIIDKVVTLLNMLNQLFARLTGANFWTKAVKGTKEYAAATGGAASKVKELQLYLAGFDDMNVLPSDNGSNGGSGGGGFDGSSGIFEEMQEFDNFPFLDKIKKMWEDADFTELGITLGEKINTALENIPWKKIQKTASKIGKSIATFLNGAIESTNWFQIGNTVAQGLNTAIEFGYNFVTNFKWEKAGEAIGRVINGWFANADFKKAAKTLNDLIHGILDSGIAAVTTVDWGVIGRKIVEAITEFDIIGAGQKFGEFAGKLFAGLADIATYIDEKYGWDTIGHEIGLAIAEAINRIDFQDILDLVVDLSKFAAGLAVELLGAVKDNWTEFTKVGLLIWSFIRHPFITTGMLAWTESPAAAIAAAIAAPLLESVAVSLFKGIGTSILAHIFGGMAENANSTANSALSVIKAALQTEAAKVLGTLTLVGGTLIIAFEIIKFADWLHENIGVDFASGDEKLQGLTKEQQEGVTLDRAFNAGLTTNEQKASGSTSEYLYQLGYNDYGEYVQGGIDAYKEKNHTWWTELGTKARGFLINPDLFNKNGQNGANTYIDGFGTPWGASQTGLKGKLETWKNTALSALKETTMYKDGETSGQNYGTGFSKGIQWGQDPASQKTKTMYDKIKSIFGKSEEDGETVGSDFAGGVKDGIETETPNVGTKSDLLKKAITDKFNTIPDTGSSIGTTFADRIKSALDKNSSLIGTSSNSLLGKMKNPFNTIGATGSGFGTKFGSEMSLGMSKQLSALSSQANAMRSKISGAFNGFNTVGSRIGADFSSALKTGIKMPTPHVSYANARSISFLGKTLSIPTIEWYAQGGFPEEGPFFMNRGEIAGRFSNGKNVVANNQQITDGIAQAVYSAFTAANQSSSGIDSNEFENGVNRLVAAVEGMSFILGDEQIARAAMRGQSSIDRRYNPVGV